jgi:hypothetical protein
MPTTQDELKRFTEFVLRHEDSDFTLPDLFDLWMLENPPAEVRAEDVAAVNASINHFLSGERGTPAGEHSRQLRAEFGIESE